MIFETVKSLGIALLMFLIMCGSVVGDEVYILWDYDSHTTSRIGFGDNPWEPQPGYEFMVVDIELENHGYPEFDVSPYNFDAYVNDVLYTCAHATFDPSIDTLPIKTIQDGDVVSGKVVYEVPKGTREYYIEYLIYWEYNFVRKS